MSFSKIVVVSFPFSVTFFVVIFFPFTNRVEVDVFFTFPPPPDPAPTPQKSSSSNAPNPNPPKFSPKLIPIGESNTDWSDPPVEWRLFPWCPRLLLPRLKWWSNRSAKGSPRKNSVSRIISLISTLKLNIYVLINWRMYLGKLLLVCGIWRKKIRNQNPLSVESGRSSRWSQRLEQIHFLPYRSCDAFCL